MIPRYSPPDMVALWSADTRYATWLEVELAACEAMEGAGLVPAGTAAAVRAREPKLSAERIEAIEATTR
ncbi:MAG TPA: adenylosuccinate lyase, partial [Polyangiaceae bacterium]|nr:adenylosuccinate lyase [Polyangiaceae bacterium]